MFADISSRFGDFRIRRWPSNFWQFRVARQLLAILGIEAPTPTDRLAALVDENLEPLALQRIEIGEEPLLAPSAEVFEHSPWRQEMWVWQFFVLNARLSQRSGQSLMQPVVAKIDETNAFDSFLLQATHNVTGLLKFSRFDRDHPPLLSPQILCEVPHRRSMQNQLLRVKAILREKQRLFNEHAHIAIGNCRMVAVQLMRINERRAHSSLSAKYR
jgi:hypothetical protein